MATLPSTLLAANGRGQAQANGVKFGRKPKLSAFQREEALKRQAAGETLATLDTRYSANISALSRL